MDISVRKSPVGRIVFVGLVYLLIGLGFGELAGSAGSHQTLVLWRLGAWVGSAMVCAVHFWYEHVRLGSFPRATAMHIALAVAVGAFGLAGAANIHSLLVASGNRLLLLLALIIWPIMTGVPAFLVAFVAASALVWWKRRPKNPHGP